MDEIIYNKKFISRFGHGEYNIIFGGKEGYQRYNKTLSEKLLQIIKSNEKNLLIDITIPYRNKDLDERNEQSRKYWESCLFNGKL